MSRTPPRESRIEIVRSEESPADAAYWAAAPQRLLDYVSEYVGRSESHPAHPGRVASPKLAEDVRAARTAWIGRMTTFSLRSVLELLGQSSVKPALEQRVIELVCAARDVCYGDCRPTAEQEAALDRALEAFAQDVAWENEPETESAE